MAAVATLKEKISYTRTVFDTLLARVYPLMTVPDVELHGKRAFVTGSNTGIGLEVARSLATQGAEVYLLCRSLSKAESARDDIRSTTGNNAVYAEVIDFGSMASVRDLVERWGRRPTPEERRIDILVNNAGISSSVKSTTADGFEPAYEVNFLSPFLLTILLLNRGDFAPNARIVQISSIAMSDSGPVNPNDLSSNDLIGGLAEGDNIPFDAHTKIYGRSKALQVVWTRELQDRLSRSSNHKGVVVQSCHPGNAVTTMLQDQSGIGRYTEEIKGFKKMMDVIGIPPAEAAKSVVFLATAQKAGEPHLRGKYWNRCGWKWGPGWMEDGKLREDLWVRWQQDANVEASGF